MGLTYRYVPIPFLTVVVLVLSTGTKKSRFKFSHGARPQPPLLGASYKVKCSVRSKARTAKIRRLGPRQVDQLDFVVAEYVSVKGAFD